MKKNGNFKLHPFGGNPPQVFWCRDLIGGLDDLKGKKIRVFNNTMRDFLGGLGAASVSMAFAGGVPGLNNGGVPAGRARRPSPQTPRCAEVARRRFPRSPG